MGIFFKDIIFCIHGLQTNVNLGKGWHRTIPKIRLMKSQNHGYKTNIYQKHEWIFADMVPISRTNHKTEFRKFGI